MDYIIREMREYEYSLLSKFIYEAVSIPEGMAVPEKSIINNPDLQVYVAEFGIKKLLAILKDKGNNRTSLAVQKANYALKMYKDMGYKIVGENEQEYIMVNYL